MKMKFKQMLLLLELLLLLLYLVLAYHQVDVKRTLPDKSRVAL